MQTIASPRAQAQPLYEITAVDRKRQKPVIYDQPMFAIAIASTNEDHHATNTIAYIHRL